MTINKNEIKKFFEDAREIRNFALGGENKSVKEEKEVLPSFNPRYIGVFLSNYYSGNINKQFHNELLR